MNLKDFTSNFHTVSMFEQKFRLCFNSITNNFCKKGCSVIFFHAFTSKLTQFDQAGKNEINILAVIRFQSIVMYVAPAFLYTLVKMVILEKFQLFCTAFSKPFYPRYFYQDLGIKEVILSVEKTLLHTRCTFLVRMVVEPLCFKTLSFI